MNVAIGRRSRRPSDTRSMALSADWLGRLVTGVELPESAIRTPPRGRIALTPAQRSVRILICQWRDQDVPKTTIRAGFSCRPIAGPKPHPVIDEGSKPVARGEIVDRTVGRCVRDAVSYPAIPYDARHEPANDTSWRASLQDGIAARSRCQRKAWTEKPRLPPAAHCRR